MTVPDGAVNQYQHCRLTANLIPVDRARTTRGALLFSGPGFVGGKKGRDAIHHVGFSLGDGTTIEARGSAWGVGSWLIGNRFTFAGLIPGVDYTTQHAAFPPKEEEDVLGLNPSALFFSNGPGDPQASDKHVALLQETLRAGLPYFGICFGNQLLGRALGLGTYKLPFGHRGINQPVLDKRTGRVEITAQNHGFAVKAPVEGTFDSPAGFGTVEVSHFSLNDNVVEGLNCLDIAAFSVQYHPEAAAGPHDANYLFDRFVELIKARESDADETQTQEGTD